MASMIVQARRLDELTSAPRPSLDRVLAVVASVDLDNPPAEDSIVRGIDALAEDCPQGQDPAVVLQFLFGAVGFVGDRSVYYDPANSLIHRVLERRRGIPLSLACIAVEVARRRQIDLRPIGMPGHVLLGLGPEPEFFFDPFDGGTRLDHQGCRELFARFNQPEFFRDSMLSPMTAEAVAIRTLNNLRVAYAHKGMVSHLVPVLELRAYLRSGSAAEGLELARLLAGLGRIEQAAAEFERLATMQPDDADDHRARATALRARLN